jgi:integrase
MGGAGGIELRENSIRILFSHQGKQRKETLYLDNAPLAPTPANAKYARRVAAEIKHKIKSGTFAYAEYFPHSPVAKANQAGSLGDFMDKWYAQLELKPSTRSEYRRVKDNFWKPKLGHLPLKSVKHSDITKALKEGTWKSNRTRNNILYMLSSAFNLAVADGLITKNPCGTIESASWQKKKPDPFSLEEANRIIASVAERYPMQVWNFYEFMFFSGLRTGEGIGLEWADIDFRKRTVLVKQAFVRGEMVDTKTSNERTVKLTTRAFEALRRQKAWTLFDESGRVFHNPNTNRPWAKEQNIREPYWNPTLKLLGIRHRRPYSTRATYATIGLMAGARPAYMAAQLGHSLDVFYRDYAAWIHDQDDDREMSKIEAQISENIPELSQRISKIS